MAEKFERQLSVTNLSLQINHANAVQNDQNSAEEVVAAVNYYNGKNNMNSGGGNKNAKCTYCGMVGHTVEKCYKKHGYPPRWIPSYKSKGKQLVMAAAASLENTILDSGATDHIVFSRDFFNDCHVVEGATLNLPNGERVIVQHRGDIKLAEGLWLKNALHIPEFRFNIVSKAGKITGFAREAEGMYLLHQPPEINSCNNSVLKYGSAELWDVIFYEDHFPLADQVHHKADHVNQMANPSLPNIPITCYEEFNIQIPNHTHNEFMEGAYNNNDMSSPHNMGEDTTHDEPVPTTPSHNHDASMPEPVHNYDEISNANSESSSHAAHNEECNGETNTTNLPIQPRRSSRLRNAPPKLQDYYCDATMSNRTSPHSISKVISYVNLSPSHKIFSMAVSAIKEPRTYNQAIQHECWKKAMDVEITALQNNQTWELTDLPPGKIPIGCKWIFKVKMKADGTIERHKARIVAKGHTQQLGVDDRDTFSQWQD
ncbi:PREDICTED: uncharacterized protein LOC109147362 [Ipomoea nil]|uniref:uncharacterized protein LOC109147362 n=1 Tax=Ipomoea nil TaxID=35883 RepID=UPI000901EDB2|nr:PREDICTED: uncharacterized protein LOC109147362 [Ipomoea nil]